MPLKMYPDFFADSSFFIHTLSSGTVGFPLEQGTNLCSKKYLEGRYNMEKISLAQSKRTIHYIVRGNWKQKDDDTTG